MVHAVFGFIMRNPGSHEKQSMKELKWGNTGSIFLLKEQSL